MSRTYTPDSWYLVKIVSEEHGVIYKVLASWYGGFTQGDSWKLSSGIESVSVEPPNEVTSSAVYTMPQSSGSTYVLYAGAEHMSGIMGGVWHNFREQVAKPDSGMTIELVNMADYEAAGFPTA